MRTILVLTTLLVITQLSFSGCGRKVVFIERSCPKLQPYEVNRSLNVRYEIR